MNIKSKGSLTVEAAFIVPIFLVGMVTILSLGQMMIFYMKMQQALYKSARQFSLECYDGRNIAQSTIRDGIVEALTDSNVAVSIIDNGLEGLDFSESILTNEEYLLINVSYKMVPIYSDMFGLLALPVNQKCVVHIWCGYEGDFYEDDNEYVYITKDSAVYHRDRECTHIKLSIRKVSGSEVEALRNSSGAKYHSCDVCKSSINDANIYITSDGNKYHNSVTCSGLKRTVRTIKITDVEGRRPCQRCGK